MNQKYLEFAREKGKMAPDVYGDADYWALSIEDALSAVKILRDDNVLIVGGDILSEDDSGKLGYAMHLWGEKYCYLGWSVSEKKELSETNYIKNSHDLAVEKIIEANKIASELNKKCYVVLTI